MRLADYKQRIINLRDLLASSQVKSTALDLPPLPECKMRFAGDRGQGRAAAAAADKRRDETRREEEN